MFIQPPYFFRGSQRCKENSILRIIKLSEIPTHQSVRRPTFYETPLTI